MKKILVLAGYGVSLKARKGLFQIFEKGKKVGETSPVEVEAIVIASRAVSITSSALVLAANYGIDVVVMDKWNPVARLIPAVYGSTMKTWIAQIAAVKKRRLTYARAFAEGKIYNQRMVLYSLYKKYTGSKHETRIIRAKIRKAIDHTGEMLEKLDKTSNVAEVRSLEAHAAKEYWKAVAAVLPKTLGFKSRIKKYMLPKGEEPDPFNKALNIGYAALLREVWKAAFLAGLNPYYGFLHAKRPGRMSLILDLMEEFRPIAVDRPLINLARKEEKEIEKLRENRKEAVAKIWKTVVDYMNKEPKPLKNIIQQQARKLAKAIVEKQEYKPYKSTW